jgi:hypothetical protein
MEALIREIKNSSEIQLKPEALEYLQKVLLFLIELEKQIVKLRSLLSQNTNFKLILKQKLFKKQHQIRIKYD